VDGESERVGKEGWEMLSVDAYYNVRCVYRVVPLKKIL